MEEVRAEARSVVGSTPTVSIQSFGSSMARTLGCDPRNGSSILPRGIFLSPNLIFPLLTFNMPHAEIIRAQTTPEDGALFEVGLRHSKWVPQQHICFTDDVRQKLVTEISSKNTGQQIIHAFEKESTLLEDIDLVLTPPALTVPVDGTFIRYVDWLGIALVDLFEWRYGSNTIATYRPEVIYSDIQYMKNERKFNQTHLLLGDMSAAQRNTYAVAPEPVRVKIPSPWRGLRCHSPLISALANKLILQVNLADARRIVQSDGTRPLSLTFNNIHLDHQNVHTTGALRGEYTGLTLNPRGLSYMVDDVETFDYAIPANTLNAANDFTIELRDLDGPIHLISVLLRTVSQLDPTNAAVDPYAIDTTYLEGLSYNIKSNGMDIQDPEIMDNDGVYKIDKFWESEFSTRQLTMNWAEYPCEKNTASGSVSFGNFTNPRLILRNAKLAGVHPELVVTVIARRFNWNVHQRGNFQKVWR